MRGHSQSFDVETSQYSTLENVHDDSSVYCRGNTKARLNDCTMHHNGNHGLWALNGAVVDLHATKTGIHSNKRHGIRAYSRGKVPVHSSSTCIKILKKI
jgi:hypothetical protein